MYRSGDAGRGRNGPSEGRTVASLVDGGDATGSVVSDSVLSIKKHATFGGEVSSSDPQLDALRDFYTATGGKEWTQHTGWSETIFDDYCGLHGLSHNPWFGLYCDGPNVILISLANNNLVGTIPSDVFLGLPYLTEIDLAGNKLTGGIPDSIGNLTALSVLNLGSNALAGDIPAILGNGPLHEIILSDNNLTGSLPEVGQFQPLTTFEVANNLLEGSIPGSFGHLPLLATLNIQGNSISGNLSVITGLDSLQSLNVASNSLGGIIPPDLNFLSSVSMLDLADNHLSGAIPDLSLLPLKIFDVSNNNLEGHVPDWAACSKDLTCIASNNSNLECQEGCKGNECYVQACENCFLSNCTSDLDCESAGGACLYCVNASCVVTPPPTTTTTTSTTTRAPTSTHQPTTRLPTSPPLHTTTTTTTTTTVKPTESAESSEAAHDAAVRHEEMIVALTSVAVVLALVPVCLIVYCMQRRRKNYRMPGSQSYTDLYTAHFGASGASSPRVARYRTVLSSVNPNAQMSIPSSPSAGAGFNGSPGGGGGGSGRRKGGDNRPRSDPGGGLLSPGTADSPGGSSDGGSGDTGFQTAPTRTVSVTLAKSTDGRIGLGSDTPEFGGDATFTFVIDSKLEIIGWDELAFQYEIARGGFGTVFKARRGHTEVAVKILRGVVDPAQVQAFVEEASVLSDLKHPNCVLCMGVVMEPGHMCIVTEFMGGGDLHELIYGADDSLVSPSAAGLLPGSPGTGDQYRVSYRRRVELLYDAARGLEYLHKRGIPHRDIKLHNMLLDDRTPQSVKLADFGLSGFKITDVTGGGTEIYAAPEVMRGSLADKRSDIYSFGVCIYEVIQRKKPALPSTGGIGRKDPIPEDWPEELSNLTRFCLARHADDRPTIGRVLEVLEELLNTLPRPVYDVRMSASLPAISNLAGTGGGDVAPGSVGDVSYLGDLPTMSPSMVGLRPRSDDKTMIGWAKPVGGASTSDAAAEGADDGDGSGGRTESNSGMLFGRMDGS